MIQRPASGRPWLRRVTSLRVRTLFLVLLAVLPAVILNYSLFRTQRRLVRERVDVDAQRLAHDTAIDQERVIEAAQQLLVTLAALPEMQLADRAACDRTLSRLVQMMPLYQNLGAALPDGTVFCSGVPHGAPASIAGHDDFHSALRGRGLSIIGYEEPAPGARPSMHLAYPVISGDGSLRAVVFASITLDALAAELGQPELPPGAALTIVDRDNRVMVRWPAASWVLGFDVTGTDLGRILAERSDGIGEAVGLDGQERLYGIAGLGGAIGAASGIRVAVGIPRGAAYAPTEQMLRYGLLGLGVVGILTLLAAWFGGELFVLKPVRALVRATRRLATGDLTARTGLAYGASAGELSELARSFDDMAASLQARATELGAMGRAARSLVQERDLGRTARAVVQQAWAALATDHAALWLVDPGIPRLELLAHVGLPERAVEAMRSIPYDADLPPSRAARTGHPVLVEDLLREGHSPAEQALAREAGARSTLDLPLNYRGRLVGVLGLSTALPHRFGAEELRLASALGDVFAAAVENARLYAEVREALRLRDEFLGAAAHELRTPATVMSAHAQLLGKEKGDEHHKRLLAGIQGAAARTSRLARELLEAHALTTQPERLNRRPADLLELIETAVEGAAATSPRHRFLVCAAGNVPVEIDRERLSLAIDALLENAARYQAIGGDVRVFVEAEDGMASVTVQDFGVGIRPERLPYVFEPLFEPWPPGSSYYVGVAGMGLHLARRIVEAHGGGVEARSELGRGSVFRFSIPRTAPKAYPNVPLQDASLRVPPAAASPSGEVP